MGSKICSRFRKFKSRIFRKKGRYDRFGDFADRVLISEAKEQNGNHGNLETPERGGENQGNCEAGASRLEVKNEQTPEEMDVDDIERLIVSLGQQLKNSSAVCGDKEERSDILNNLGAAYYKLCDFQMSKKYYEMYFKTIKKEQSPVLMQRAYCNLGCVYRRLGDFDNAEENFQKGLEISEELRDMKAKGRLLNNLGNICEMKKDFEGAIYFHSQRRKLAEKLGDWDSEAKACASLGNANHLLGNLRNSIVFYERLIVWLKRKEAFHQKEGRRLSVVSRLPLEEEQWV